MSHDLWRPQKNENGPGDADWNEALRFARYCVSRYPRSFFGVGILSLLSTSLILPVPLISKSIVNTLVAGGNHTAYITFLALLALAAIVFERFVNYWQGVVIFPRCRMLIYDLRRGILQHLLAIPMLSLQETEPGVIGACVYNDTEKALEVFYEELISVCRALITIAVCITAMAIIQWHMTVMVLAAIPVYICCLRHFGRKIRRVTAGYYDAIAADRSLYHHLLAGPEIAKIHSSSYVIDNYNRLTAESIASGERLVKAHALSNSVAGLVSNSLPVFILLFGALLIIGGIFDLGSFVAFSAFSAYMFPSLRLIAEYVISAQAGLVALKRINELLEKDAEEGSESDELPQGSELFLDNVGFTYPSHGRVQLRNIFLRIRKGRFIGIMGESGSGKSTLLKVICGLYAITEGKIRLDGRPVTPGTMRKLTAYVEQEPLIFEDTLVENVRLGRSDISTQHVLHILKEVGLGALLRQLDHDRDGENHALTGPHIHQGGSNLSAGQKKRIALARALMKNAPIIVVDEPTAGLDWENSVRVMGLIRRVCAGKLVVIVSHSDQVTDYCDEVYEIRGSRLTALNKHTAARM